MKENKEITTKISQETLIFCQNIKKLREREKLSKKEMAKRLEIGVKSLTMLENGTIPKRLSCKFIFRIEDEFNILPKNIFKPL